MPRSSTWNHGTRQTPASALDAWIGRHSKTNSATIPTMNTLMSAVAIMMLPT